MLKKEAVSEALFNVLNRLMGVKNLANHRLVGGTAYALQVGHRISVDIDLFSDTVSDYHLIEKEINQEFGTDAKLVHYIRSPLGRGISYLIGGIKTDLLDWNRTFHFPVETIEGIRMAGKTEIMAMKLDILTGPPEFVRYEKKDFIDLSFMLLDYSLEEMLALYRGINPDMSDPERLVLEALQLAELADKKPNPKMLRPLDWQEAKNIIQTSVLRFLDEKTKDSD